MRQINHLEMDRFREGLLAKPISWHGTEETKPKLNNTKTAIGVNT